MPATVVSSSLALLPSPWRPAYRCGSPPDWWSWRRSQRSFARGYIGWPRLIAALILIILFIPIRRYTLPANLPFQLEPYRAVRRLARCSGG